ncbi:MAG: glucokinase [Methylococcaceae bacterium]|nr:glucokinase [Methylococcaceae bacterium]
MILAGDIGGTKTVLTLLSTQLNGTLACAKEQTYASQQFAQFDDILSDFLPADVNLISACFGIAGPVVEQRCQTTNLPWLLDGEALKIRLGTEQVKLLNDLEAMALGMLSLPADDLLELNPNAVPQKGNIAVIAAGTGLGEAVLYWDGSKHQPMATEGGHTDWAAQNAQQDQLLAFLRGHFPDHVSAERIISGIGFSYLYDFLVGHGSTPPCAAVSDCAPGADRNAVISELGVTGQDALCAEVVRWFVELYGAEAGNLALKSLATGGVFIGGGIAPKILPALQNGDFMRAFTAKGRFAPLLQTLSVKVSLNPRTPLIGAINYFA